MQSFECRVTDRVGKKVLEEIGAAEKPVINVFNKSDRLEGGMVPPHLKLIEDDAVALSALTGAGISDLIVAIGREL